MSKPQYPAFLAKKTDLFTGVGLFIHEQNNKGGRNMKFENSFPDAFDIIEKVLSKYSTPVELGDSRTLSPFLNHYVEIDRDGHQIILVGAYDGKRQTVDTAIYSTEHLTFGKRKKIEETLNMINPSIPHGSFDINIGENRIFMIKSFYNESNRTLEGKLKRHLELLFKNWDNYYPTIHKIIRSK